MNHLLASPPWFLPRSIGAAAHLEPACGFSSVTVMEPLLSSHLPRSPDSKSSVKMTAGSLAIPRSPGYLAASPAPSGGFSAAASAAADRIKAGKNKPIARGPIVLLRIGIRDVILASG